MEYVLVFNEPQSEFDKRDDPVAAPEYWGAWKAYIGAMAASGVMKHGNGLTAPADTVRVQLRGGKQSVQDGPMPDSKELLGGYVSIEVDSLAAAIEWAGRSPAATAGTVEIRAVLPPMPH